MFERYTEKARRVIFFARFEASTFGSPYIESEHMLLGLLREDRTLSMRFITPRTTAEALRKEIERHAPPRESIPTSVDLPLSNECKHVLAYAAEEAERLGHPFIGSEHLFLGILREENSFASELLQHHGIKIDEARKDIAENQPPVPSLHTSPPSLTIGTLGFFQLVLKVTNLNASIDFYTKLGFIPTGQHGPGTAVLSNGNCILRLDQNAVADHALGFLTHDIVSTISRLRPAGVEFEQQSQPATDGSTTALLRDPDGNVISLSSPAYPKREPPR